MVLSMNVLLVSRNRDMVDQLAAVLQRYENLRIQKRLVVNGHADPLHGVDAVPDALILHLSHTWRDELEALSHRPASFRPPVIVLGPGDDTEIMRHAIRAGARDFLPVPIVEQELIEALTRIARDKQAVSPAHRAALTVFMNAKGGSGATLLACNVAHIMRVISERRVALLDLDVQFGTLPLYFDMFPKRGLLQALENLDELDELALDGYMVKHASGLKVLGNATDDGLLTQEINIRQIERLIDLAGRSHDHLVVDLPRRIDEVSVAVIERAQQIAVVVQQSLTTLRDAGRLLQILRRDLAVPRDNLCVVVNRYDKNAPVSLEDIEKTLRCGALSLVPNDFRTVSECINTGTALYDRARGASITKALMALETRLGGSSASERKGILARTFSILKPRSTWQQS